MRSETSTCLFLQKIGLVGGTGKGSKLSGTNPPYTRVLLGTPGFPQLRNSGVFYHLLICAVLIGEHDAFKIGILDGRFAPALQLPIDRFSH